MTIMMKLTGTIKVPCLLPTTYTDKFRQNRVYIAKNSTLLPAPCSSAVLVKNETALPSKGGQGGDKGDGRGIGGFRGRRIVGIFFLRKLLRLLKRSALQSDSLAEISGNFYRLQWYNW